MVALFSLYCFKLLFFPALKIFAIQGNCIQECQDECLQQGEGNFSCQTTEGTSVQKLEYIYYSV